MRIPPLEVLFAVTALGCLAACAVGPHYHGPPSVKAASGWTEPAATQPIERDWWRVLGDPLLDELISAALERNLDLRTAEAQVREARANRQVAAGALYPELDASAAINRNELSANGELPIGLIPGFSRRFNLFDGGFDASWELDFWGRVRHTVEGADARAQSAVEARRNVEIEILSEVVRSYVDLRNAQAQLESASQDAEARRQTAELVHRRYAAGEASLFDDARATAQARSTESELPGLKADARAAAYSLALLTARPPETLIELAQRAAPLPAAPPQIHAGLRSELLRRRPDVREAERELAAATADVGAATADYFPRVTLIGAVGQQARQTGELGSSMSTRFEWGPSLSWPLFSAGRIRAQVHATQARAEEAALRYEKAVLNAFADSETALNRWAAARSERTLRTAALDASLLAVTLARQRYRAGEDDLVDLLAAESDYRASEQTALNARAAELRAAVTLYKALGGGWT